VLEVRHPKDIAQLRHFDTYYANSWYVYLRYSEHRLPMLLEFSYRTTLLVWLTLSTAATLEWRRRSHGKGVRRPSAAYYCDLLRACSPLVFIGHPMLNANSRYCVPS